MHLLSPGHLLASLRLWIGLLAAAAMTALTIRVRRYLCEACRRTVSLLPEFALPYLRSSLAFIAWWLMVRFFPASPPPAPARPCPAPPIR